MTDKNAVKIFEEKQVRTVWDGEQEKWYFSIIDVIAVLTGNERPREVLERPEDQAKARGKSVVR